MNKCLEYDVNNCGKCPHGQTHFTFSDCGGYCATLGREHHCHQITPYNVEQITALIVAVRDYLTTGHDGNLIVVARGMKII